MSKRLIKFVQVVSTKGGLRSIDNVEESIRILLVRIKLRKTHGVGNHRFLVDKKEEGLIGMKRKTSTNDVNEFSDRDVIWNEEL